MTLPSQFLAPMDDGPPIEPESKPALTPAPADPAEQASPFQGLGPWLEKPDLDVFKEIDTEVKRQEPSAKNRLERKKVNEWQRQGKSFARLKGIDKMEDRNLWKATLPEGMGSAPPVPNKVDDLCNKITAQLTTDPPVPDAQPESDSDEHRAAAEFATRWLKADGDESGTNDARLVQRAINYGCTAGTVYVHDYVNPVGAGWRPKEIMADPTATDAKDPVFRISGRPPTGDPIKRYVTADGQITDDASQADRQWLPKICSDHLFSEHIRLLPEFADGIESAEGVVILDYAPLSELQSSIEDFPSDPETLKALASWKPTRHTDLLPKGVVLPKSGEPSGSDAGTEDGEVPPHTLIFFYRGYRKSTPIYPEGAYVIVSGANKGLILHKQPWSAVIDQPDGTKKKECLDLPLAPFKQLDDVMWGDPNGQAVIERFGMAGQLLATLSGSVTQVVDQALNPNVFLAATSPVQPKQLTRRDGTPIPVTNVNEDKPYYEPPPQIPEGLVQFLIEWVTSAMDSASGLQQTAQGTEAPDVTSGIQAQTVIEQSLVALGQLFQNMNAGVKRHWRIKMQLARSFMPIPQLMAFVGDDGAYKQQEWTGSDFTGVRDVSIQKGTGTMMAPSAKQQMVATMQQMFWLSPDEAAEIAQSGISPVLGIQDNVHRNRIRRDIAAWKQGPPENWDPMEDQQYAMAQQQYAAIAQEAAVAGQPAPEAPPAPWTPFDPRPNDEEPLVAKVRHAELTKLISSSAYTKHPPEWRAKVDVEYERMAYAAGVQTMRQQAEAQQMQQQQQAEANAQQLAADGQNKDADRSAKAEESDKQRAFQAQEGDADRQAQANATQAKLMQGPMTNQAA